MALHNGFGRRVVDVELLGHVDDRPPILDAAQQLDPCFLAHFLVVFGGPGERDKDGLDGIADNLN